VATFLAAYGSNTISTSGNITAGNLIGNISITGNVTGTGTNVNVVAGAYTWSFDNTGNLVLSGNTFAVNYANGTAVSLGGNYGNANVVANLAALSSNPISTTGNITGGNIIATANVLANGYARLTGSFDESQASTAGLYLGYAGGTPRIMFGTGNTNQTLEIDNDGGTLRFYKPGTTLASLTNSGVFSAAGNITGANIATGGSMSATGNATAGNLLTSGQVSATGTMSASSITLSSTGTAVNASSGNILTNKVTGTQFAFLNGLYTATLTGGGATANYSLALPANAGTNGQVLTSDGSGGLSWTTPAGTYANANVAAYGESGWAGNIIPSANVTYDLGNASNRWNDLYLAGNTIYLGGANITSSGTTVTLPGDMTTTGNVTAANLGNVAALNLNGVTGQVLAGDGAFRNMAVIGSSNIIIQNATPGSWSGTYTSSGGRLALTAYATAFASGVGSYTYALQKNGSNVATSTLFVNATVVSTHLPLPLISYVDTSGDVGSATWSIVLGAGLNADFNDYATITVTETTGITNPAFSAYNSSAVGLTNTGTKVTYTSEEFDTNNNYDTSTSIYTPTVAGYYQVTVSTMVPNTSVLVSSMIYKNGAKVADGPGGTGGGFFYGSSIASKLVYMNGTTDYLEGYAIVSSNVNTYNNAVGTYFQAYMIRGV
jgi:hypothetical protein